MLKIGIILTAATVTILVAEFFRTRRRPLPVYGWLGLIALVCAEFLMFHGVEPAATYFNPLAWTAYILLADGAVFAITGHSRLRDEARGFLKMAALSVLLWLIFEAYNLRLENWAYVGLPQARAESWFGYAWSFATITPGIFMTAAMVEAFGSCSNRSTTASFCPLSRETSLAVIAGACTRSLSPDGFAAGCGNSGITGRRRSGSTHFRSSSNGKSSKCRCLGIRLI